MMTTTGGLAALVAAMGTPWRGTEPRTATTPVSTTEEVVAR